VLLFILALLCANAAIAGRRFGRSFDVEQRQAEVEQLRAQLDAAKYDLDQTTVRAPGDGYVSSLALNKGDRAPP
jgi:multidrug resistance efflux pump